MSGFVPASELRARFAAMLSDMYRAEVPQYGALLALVADINRETLVADPTLADALRASGEGDRIDAERHGAIRLGTARELRCVARAFRLMGMRPVGYYDLAAAGVPVHSTAFRPVDAGELAASPFRVFTSLLRLELIEDVALRDEAAAILSRRSILTEEATALLAAADANGGLDEAQSERFLPALLETFRWHSRATIDREIYDRLLASHRLVADVVSFPGPHINHLTPRVLDIDAAHARMAALGFGPKDTIEGPPRRRCPILLRQTSFKALSEAVAFPGRTGLSAEGSHTARFGEIEQRGAALTREGRARYDRLIAGEAHTSLPDDADALRRERLAFFRYRPAESAPRRLPPSPGNLEALIADGAVVAAPITYEDFLPVSAAGIFRSNLGDEVQGSYAAAGSRPAFEEALGEPVSDEFTLYARDEAESLAAVDRAFGWPAGTARS
ncbi:VOC family protein [Sphingomonas sp. BIUV-7]|uniref:2-oxoadipate dioxygenase/decarboxylase n=1 Tax=Sphingomonas natans TaxID=3063330 RepID=A0ABT8Y8Z7_9SPHN|nr:VOC family protein [Sphingomonas sp. BIUV-7]MDO6414803.1 VOC family protein [Sphingomonas sp. BIUV-7]